MVYNGWFLVSAVIGGGIGYFIFGQLFMKINIQNCHIMRQAYCSQICGEIGKFCKCKYFPSPHQIFLTANSTINTQSSEKYDLV